ncbi:hypothetical protein QNH14_14920 [Apirhabdus apintestini]|uniref:hypothetical protein n=1 Tax=Erwinia sp. HR93 TaxID=3094840 RepID=UPI002ADEF98E|nr:hypothetical protein [Erwinia sp. HR93]MEA1064230.1 hypothetical protein [Erwinia sp. HR93]WPM84230.1 hypothetical protein QNH14_14920 [Enterobacteriaceae bacterium CA-0114]
MFHIGDIVQPRVGGPKMAITAIYYDRVIVTPVHGDKRDKITLKIEDITPYQEDGDFGVC